MATQAASGLQCKPATAFTPVRAANARTQRRGLAVPCAKQQHQEEVSIGATQRAARTAVAVAAGVQLLLSSTAGPALAALDTTTKPAPEAGAGAMVEGSDLRDQSGRDALARFADVTIPQVETALNQLDKSEAQTVAQEVNAVTAQVSKLSERVEQGISEQELKSEVSALEQQLNAAKATAGLD